MDKGGGGGHSTTTATTYTSNLPEYARGYYERLMGKSEAAYDERVEKGYNGGMSYQGPRLAGPSQEEQAAWDARRDFFYEPNNYSDFASSMINRAGEVPGNLRSIEGGPAWNSGIASHYMSPYMDAVTQRAANAAETRYQIDRDKRAADGAMAGGRGGYREAIMDVTGQAEHQKNLADIWAGGRQDAWTQGQQQYERDVRRGMDAGIASNQSILGAGDLYRGIGESAIGIGGSDQQQRLARIAQLEGVGQTRRADEQRQYDVNYNDFLQERDWEINQYANLLSMLSGVPVQPNQGITNYASSPGWAQQLAGAGIGAYSLGNMLGK